MSILCVGVAPNDGKLKGLLFCTLKYTAFLHIELVVTFFFLFEANVGVMVFFETTYEECYKCKLERIISI